MSREMRHSGIEWIGEIPKEWKVSSVRWIMVNKSIRNQPNAEVLSLYRDWGIVPKSSRDDNHNVTSEDTSNYKVVQKGDFVINKMKAWQGSMAVSEYDGIISPAYYVCSFIDKNICKRYIHHLLRNESYKTEYMRLSSGLRVGQWDLNIENFLRIPIVLPSLSEQQKIADYLDKVCGEVDEMIALQEQMIEELKAYKQSVITEAVTKGLNPNAPMKDSGIDWIGDVPEHWKLGRLKRISNKIGDGLHGTPEFVDNSCYYFINGNNLGRKQIEIYGDTNKVDKAEFDKYYIELDENTILISLNGTIGNLSFYNGEMVILGKSAGYVRLKSQSNKHYYYYYLQALNVKEYFYLSLAGTTIGNLSLGTLRNTPITIPPISEQQSIASYLDTKCVEIDALIAIKQAKIEELKDYKKSVIYEYVTGKKEVV